MTSKMVYAPNNPKPSNLVDVFLAGSIEMGTATEWQSSVAKELSSIPEVGHIFNPRRLDFDITQAQRADNDYFSTQVNWELDHITASPVIFVWFDPNTKSPVTLAELGYLLGMKYMWDRCTGEVGLSHSIVVGCPQGFWRRGNIEIMMERAGLELHSTLDECLIATKQEIQDKHSLMLSLQAV